MTIHCACTVCQTMTSPNLPIMEERTFGDWLRQRRKDAGLTQLELAEAMGRGRTYIVKIENGSIGTPQPEQRAAIHSVLGSSEEELQFLGLIPSPRSGWAFSFDKDRARDLRSETGRTRELVSELVMDRRIPDDVIEGIRTTLLQYVKDAE